MIDSRSLLLAAAIAALAAAVLVGAARIAASIDRLETRAHPSHTPGR